MSTLRPVRGTHDIVGDDALRHRQVIETGRAVAARYGYAEVATPIFEFTEVFARTLGETSDVVTKEMYSFTDRGGEALTLRPEYTAGVARAFISGALGQNLPVKLFCSGPMFRYERPQKGRLRQFHQIDVEVIGAPEPLADVEVIALGAQILRALGLAEHVRLELNTLGDPDSRQAYRDRLVGYLSAYRDRLSPDSQARLERNPLRILDSKDEGDREILKGAPTLDASLNEASKAFFAGVRAGLDALGIAYAINPMLVRGLDYYTHTAFEFTTDRLGAQGAVLAGGRYDGLVAAMGGPDTPGIGWAAGVERLAMLLDETPASAAAGRGRADRRSCRAGGAPARRGAAPRRPRGRVRLSRQARPAPEERRAPACALCRAARRGRAGGRSGRAARPRSRRPGDHRTRRPRQLPGSGNDRRLGL